MYIPPAPQITANMAEKFIAASPSAAAEFFGSLSTHEALQLLGRLKAETLALCLGRMEPQKCAPILRRLPPKQASAVTAQLNINLAARVLALVPPHHKIKIEEELPPHFRAELKNALNYPEGSAGNFIKHDFTAFKTEDTIENIISRLKNIPRKKVPAQLYVLDKAGRLAGVIKTADMIFYAPATMAGSLMQTDFAKITAETPADDADGLNLPEIPVVNDRGALIGIYVKPQETKKSKGLLSIFK